MRPGLYINGLMYDYLVDCGLSFADELIGGFFGLDVGDWIAALIILSKERKITNRWVALLAAWEAANFIPMSFIPVIGNITELFFNFFPAVTISRALFNKYGPAEKTEDKLKKEISTAKELGIDVSGEKKIGKKVKQLLEASDPVDALKEATASEQKLAAKLRERVDKQIQETEDITERIADMDVRGPSEAIQILVGGIGKSRKLLREAQEAEQQGNFSTAIDRARTAHRVIQSSVEQFDRARGATG